MCKGNSFLLRWTDEVKMINFKIKGFSINASKIFWFFFIAKTSSFLRTPNDLGFVTCACITWGQHQKGRGSGELWHLTAFCISNSTYCHTKLVLSIWYKIKGHLKTNSWVSSWSTCWPIHNWRRQDILEQLFLYAFFFSRVYEHAQSCEGFGLSCEFKLSQTLVTAQSWTSKQTFYWCVKPINIHLFKST